MYIKGALLMISLTSIKTVFSSSKWLQTKQNQLQKNGGMRPEMRLCSPFFSMECLKIVITSL